MRPDQLTEEEKAARFRESKDGAISVLLAAAERVENWRRRHCKEDIFDEEPLGPYDCAHSCCGAIKEGTEDERFTVVEGARLQEIFQEYFRPADRLHTDLWWPNVSVADPVRATDVQNARILALLLLAEMIETEDIKL